jgi:hypothetical protein
MVLSGGGNAGKVDARMTALDGIEKAAVIERVVARNVKDKAWRSECEKEALAYVRKWDRKSESDFARFNREKAAVLAYCKTQYDSAGANWQGRW